MRFNGKRILIVEDEELIRDFLAIDLESEGASVVTVGAVKDAFSELGQVDFDLVLSDIIMPEANGTDLIPWHVDQERTKLVFMTGFANDDFIKIIRDANFPLIEKPFCSEVLMDELESALGMNA